MKLSLKTPGPDHPVSAAGLLLLRVVTGGLVFIIHGWHKLPGGLAYFRDGTSWPLAAEIAEIGLPAPVLAASFATAVQFVAAPLLVLGLGTRIVAILLTAVLAGAVAQNLLSGRDPQLALLYVTNATVLALMGGGRFSVDAVLARKRKGTV
jgi:putative oxidoreductase